MAKKKLQAELVAIADHAMTGEDKKISIIGIFDKLFVRTLPTTHARMSFVVTFSGEPRTTEDLVLRVVNPSGKDEFKADVKINFGENGKFNFISNFEGFPFNDTGSYTFVFDHNGEEVVSYTLDVIQVKDENTPRVAN